jgi:hypothetical protein
MYILVESVFDSPRTEVAEETKKTFIDVTAELDNVKVQRYHPSRQGIIVVDMTPAPLDPTTPFKRSLFAKIVRSGPPPLKI